MEPEKRIDYIWIPGIGTCWRFRLPKVKGVIPCREVRRIIEDVDSESIKILFGYGETEKGIVLQMSLDSFLKTLAEIDQGMEHYEDEYGNLY